MSLDTEERCKVWRKTDSWLQKCLEEFSEIEYKQWQVWKFALCCPTFVKSIFCLSQKVAEDLCVITLKSDAKCEEELTCVLKIDIGHLMNTTGTLKNLKICCSLRSCFSKVYNVWAKKLYRRHDTDELCNV